MNTKPSALIEAKGDAKAFAEAIGTEASRVRMWKHREIIPRAAWPEIMIAFPDVTLPVLLTMERAG